MNSISDDVSLDPGSVGLKCLVIVAGLHQVNTSVESLQHEHVVTGPDLSDSQLAEIARSLGLRAKVTGHLDSDGRGRAVRALLQRGGAKLPRLRSVCLGLFEETKPPSLRDYKEVFPALARLKNSAMVVLVGLREQDGQTLVGVVDPLAKTDAVILVPLAAFEEQWTGRLILIQRSYRLDDQTQPFGLRWFVPEILRHRALLRDVMIAALVIQIIGLAPAIFLRVVLDRVLIHESWSTLVVLTVGVVLALLFESLFTYLRQYILIQATNKIDIRLAVRIFAHLMSLPISYFEMVPGGVTVRHLQQAEKIRSFLTGRMLTVALEMTTLLVYLPLLCYLSGKLTLVVLGFGLLISGVVLALVGPFRTKLQALYNAEANRQAMLVETVNGMRSIKSLTLEPGQRRAWEERSAQAVELHNKVAVIGAGAGAVTGFFEKSMLIAVVSVGAVDVFSGQLSVGALIAFQMLAGRVISPLVQLASLIQDYQDTALSVRMLGQVMNRPSEPRSNGGGLQPKVAGQIEFDRVTFRYTPGGVPALDQVGLRIPAGKIVGLVGRSGSGKSTVAKLMQNLYPFQDGVIRIDGIDIREFDLTHLRRNICVVPQDTFIFRGSVRDNIALTNRSAGLEEIVAVARLAGADEFIERLPNGYDTELEEGGQNLSGGQKQRLSISRALLLRPPILVLDEATSALDPDSEAIFLDNLSGIAAGRTTLIISHRLNTLTHCDALVILERGKIIDAGTHAELLQRCEVYRHLWRQQNRGLS
ncbi:ABC transporter [Magnetospirillum fulvum MGU-K5]|uniref:ABC transporter n=2 Tax=Magnetospirillum fulvum TaxID=1082 RepID=S9S3P4_MAGFU|nr:ABC transporter [Magnetospirillum fulvum MGU-K5]